MTFDGTARFYMQRAATKALKREIKDKSIKRFHALRDKHIQNQDAYDAVVEFNRLHGFEVAVIPKRLTKEQSILKLHSAKSKRHVTLPGEVEKGPDERTLAEDRALEGFKKAIEIMEFHLIELTHIPNPCFNYKNRVNQKHMVDLVSQMARCLKLNTQFSEGTPKLPPIPLKHICLNCGGPATDQRNFNWYCEDCIDERCR